MTANLTPDAHAALVGIIRRAAQRGRGLREQKHTVITDEPGQADSDDGGTSAPLQGEDAKGEYTS